MRYLIRRRFCRRLALCFLTAVALITIDTTRAYCAGEHKQRAPFISFRIDEVGGTEIIIMHRSEPLPIEQIQQALEESLRCKLRDAKLVENDGSSSGGEIRFEEDGDEEEDAAGVGSAPGTTHSEFMFWTFTAKSADAFPRHSLHVAGEIYLEPICTLFKSNVVNSITVALFHPEYGYSQCTEGEERAFAAQAYGYHYYSVPVEGSALQTINISYGYEASSVIVGIALPLTFLILPIAVSLFLRRATLKAEGDKRQAAWRTLWKATSWIAVVAWVGWSFIFSFPFMSGLLRLVFRSGGTAIDAGLNMGIYLIPPTFVIGLCYALMLSVHMRMRGIAYTRRDLVQHVLVEQTGTMLVILLFSMGIGSIFFDPGRGILMLTAAFIVATIVGSLKKRFMNLAPYAIEVGELRDRIFELAKRCGVKLKQIYILPEDKMRTINAMASSGNHIILTNALLANLNRREVDSVVAHELGHLKHRHPNSLTTIFVVGVLLINIGTGAVWSLLGFNFGFTVFVLVFLFAINWFSRKFEYTADIHSLYLIGDPRPLISALAKMSRLMLLPMSSDPLSELVSTHPYTKNRAEALARFGNVSSEELEQLVASSDLNQERYDLESITGNKDRAFSTAAKQKTSNRIGLILLAAKTIPPALIALVALKLGLSDSARLMVYLTGLVTTTAVYFWLNNVLPVTGCKAIVKKLREKLECEGIDPNHQQGLFVGFSPAAEIRYYENNDDWDLGYLIVTGNRLCYIGEQTRFALFADQIREIEVVSGSASWWKSERVFITWLDAERNEIKTFNLHPCEATSLRDGNRKTRSLAQRLRDWKSAPAQNAAVPASLSGLAKPQIGEVTSQSLSEIAGPGKVVNLVFICVFIAIAVCLVLHLPFNPQRGGGALYVIAVTLIVTLVEARPWLQNAKQQNPKIAQQQQPVARLEAAD